MEKKKGIQTSRPPRAEASLNVRNASSQRGRSITDQSVLDDPDQTESSRISTDASTLLTSDSNSKEFIIIYPKISSVPIPKSAKGMENDVSDDALCKLEEYLQSSSSSTSQISDVTHESGAGIPTVLPIHRPPIQVMDRTGGFDPDRIPASIFAKPTTMVDWSLASNESLFSIQIGKSSFSIDHASQEFIREGSFSHQSGEMIKSHKLSLPKQVKESGGVETCKEAVSIEKEENPLLLGVATRISEEPIANRVKIKIEGFGNGNVIHTTQSKQQSPKSSCACSSCPTCRCCSWPGCSCKRCCWINCSCMCFSCATCHSWLDCSCKKLCCRGCGLKWTSFSSCCCKWQICCCTPSTWACCKCRCTTWSLKKILCCLASKSSAKIASTTRLGSNTDAKKKWCTCLSCCSSL